MVHFSQSLISDEPLATSLPTTFTFQPANSQLDDPSNVQQQQQQNLTNPSQSQLNSNDQQQRSSSNDDANNPNHPQSHPNDYETRLR